jgi:hypothetical protein
MALFHRRMSIGSLVALALALALAVTLPLARPRPLAAQELNNGQPYASPQYCAGLPAAITRLQSGLDQQRDWLRKAEDHVKAAEEGSAEAETEMKLAVVKAINDLAHRQLESIKVLQDIVETKDKAWAASQGIPTLTDAKREAFLKLTKHLEDGTKVLESLKAGADYGAALQTNQANLASLSKFIEDSGIGKDAVMGLAKRLGPEAELLTESALMVQDLVYNGLKAHLTAQEAAQARENYDRLKASLSDIDYKIAGYQDDLSSGLCGPKAAIQVQNSPKPTEGSPIPIAPADPPASSGGVSAGKVIAVTTLSAGAAVGGIVAAQAISAGSSPSTTSGSCVTPAVNPLDPCSAGQATACSAALAAYKTYCQCLGYSGFNAGIGSCQ